MERRRPFIARFLSRDGLGKAPIKPQRMMLGPVSGGCVRLGPVAEHILLGEGIETCLSAMQAIGLPAWAALTTSGFKGLDLPPDVLAVTILCDGDDAGRKAARSAATRWAPRRPSGPHCSSAGRPRLQ